MIKGSCSCPVSYNCKHVAAVCVAYINQVIKKNDSSETSSLILWSNTLKQILEKNENSLKNENDYFLIYRFFQNSGYYDNEISFYKVKYLKDGKFGKGTKLDSRKVVEGHYENILSPLDKEIVNLLKPFYQYYHVNNINGSLGFIALQKIIGTNKAFYKEENEPIKFIEETFNTDFSIIKDKDLYILRSNVNDDYEIINTKPPLIFQKSKNSFSKFDMDLDIFKIILKAPAIPKNQINELFKIVSSNIPNLNLRPPNDISTKTIDTKPVINLYLKKIIDEDNNTFFAIKVDFSYENYKVKYFKKEQSTTVVEDKIINIKRDLKTEDEAFYTLKNYGFELKNKNNDITADLDKTNVNIQNQLNVWSDFLQNGIYHLKNQGWKIIQDEEFNLKFSSNAQVVVQNEQNNNWFSLSFDLKLEDMTIPVAPLVSGIIDQFENFENLPSFINIEVDQNHFTKVKTDILKPILKTILELYDKTEKENRIKILPYDAHLIEDLNDQTVFLGSNKILELSKQLKNFQGIKHIEPPKALNATLRDYQLQGYNWLHFLHMYGFGGILADDMGLGKTIQTLSFLSKLKEDGKLQSPSLIVMPTSLIANWKNETKKFTPDLTILSVHGENRKENFCKIKDHDIILTTYPLILRDFEDLKDIKFEYIILDEAQKIKNPLAKMTKYIKTLNSKHKLALSGTPVENHLGELWSIFDFLMPGFLDTKTFFKQYYQIPIEKDNDIKKQQLLNKKIKPFMLRRTKEIVANELPLKTEIIKYTQFEPKQSKLYESIRLTMEKKVKESIKKKGIASSHIAILDALLKLRQICCDPKLLNLQEASNIKESAKLELFLDLIEELLSEERKILVFSQFTSMISILEENISKRGINYAKLTGSTKDREKEIEKFTNGEVPLFFISLKAGGVGLNLTQADTVIHYDPWWNPAVENQATDRAYRIGQDKKVFVYKLIVENTIEQKILQLQEKKKIIQNNIYQKDGQQNDLNFSSDELLDLLR